MNINQRRLVESYYESVYGPGVFTREDDQLLIDGVPVSDIEQFPLDQRDSEFFTNKEYVELILNKVVRDPLPSGSVCDDEFVERAIKTSSEPDILPES